MFLCKISWCIITSDWNDRGEFKISTLEELEQILDRFEEQHQGNKASIVQIFLPSGTYMMVGLGHHHQLSCLSYVSPHDSFCPCRIGIGDKNDKSKEVIEFLYGNQTEEFRKRESIPKEIARRAVRYFVQTGGELTDEVTWDTDLEKPDQNDIDYDGPF